MRKITKAVIPAAGLGTRVLPATKSIPKEMLPLVDKPAIHYLVEEAVQAGITDILIVTNRGKSALEDYFDRAPELEERLLASGKQALYEQITALSRMANIQYVRQKETKGLGHAVLCARAFAAGEPVAVLYGDDVIVSPPGVSATGELCAAWERYGLGVAGIRKVPESFISKYSSLKVAPLADHLFHISDMIEKPAPEKAFSLYSVVGRCILPPAVFDILEDTPPGAGGEIQLTDAMARLARGPGMIGVEYSGTHYDMGNKLCLLKATVELGLAHEELGAEFRAWLREYAKAL